MKRLIPSFFFAFFVFLNGAHAATLSGFVRDIADGESLPNATIAFDELALGALSNADGYYAVQGLPPGTHVVTISYIGYRAFRDTLSFADGQ